MKSTRLMAAISMLAVVTAVDASVELALDSEDGQVYWDSESGDYIIKYVGPAGDAVSVRWIPGNKIDPKVDTKLRQNPVTDLISYELSLVNGANAKQSISFVGLEIPVQPITGLSSPPQWQGAQGTPDQGVLRITWWADCGNARCIEPGHRKNNYLYQAAWLPGLAELKVQGDMPTLSFPDYGPGGEVREFLDEHLIGGDDWIRLYVAAPMIKPDGSASESLNAIADHLETLSALQGQERAVAEHAIQELRSAAEAWDADDIGAASRILGQLRGYLARSSAGSGDAESLKVLREVLLFDINLIQSRRMGR